MRKTLLMKCKIALFENVYEELRFIPIIRKNIHLSLEIF